MSIVLGSPSYIISIIFTILSDASFKIWLVLNKTFIILLLLKEIFYQKNLVPNSLEIILNFAFYVFSNNFL